MIVPMKHVSLVCFSRNREAMLEVLRDIGVVHLSGSVTPQGDDLEEAKEELNHRQQVLKAFPGGPDAAPTELPAEQVLENVWKLATEVKALNAEIEELRHEEVRIAPLGQFKPEAVARLGERGLHVRFFRSLPKHHPEFPPGCIVTPLEKGEKGNYFAVVSRDEVEVDAEEVPVPRESLDHLNRRIEKMEADVVHKRRAMRVYAGDHERVRSCLDESEERVEFLQARDRMAASGKLSYIQGYCPVHRLESVQAAADENGWGLLAEDPGEDDPVPTLIRYPKWAKPIRVIFEGFGILPGYREVDVAPVFLIFMGLFSAMLVGDAGYGLLFLLATLWGRKKFPNAPKPFFSLMQVLSISTIVWGALTGNYFGIVQAPAPLAGFKIEWLKDQDNIMFLCFLIGAIHLTIAHIWNAIAVSSSLEKLAQVGWIGSTWTMYFAAGTMVLGRPWPGWVTPMFIVSAVLILLFMTPFARIKKDWDGYVMLPLTFVSNFVDIVSYLRLYAVGYASMAVAGAFNDLALGDGLNSVLGGLGAAAILFLGHGLNILLCCMGILVHAIRLNTLEFSSHLKLGWTGSGFAPFRRKHQDEDTAL